MFSEVAKHTIRALLLILFQGLVLNHVQLGGYINPFLYILFILMLPFETPPWLVLIFGFIGGLSVDVFSNTGGMHASATTLMAYLRPKVLQLIEPREGYESGMEPTLQIMGSSWYFSYAATLILIHHTWLFFIEVFRFTDVLDVFIRILLSGVFTFVLVILSQYLLFQQRRRA